MNMLISSNSKNAKYIQEHIKKIIYTHQFGSKKERQELSSKILGVSIDVVQAIGKSTNPILCVYLFTLGTVKKLRESMRINEKYKDDEIVCKYGFTKDLSLRARQHKGYYEKTKNVKVNLKYYRYIDSENLSKAEKDIKTIVTPDRDFKYKKYKELFIASNKDIKTNIKKRYDEVETLHCIKNKEYAQIIKDLKTKHEKEITSLIHKNELAARDNELAIKDVTIKNIKLKADNANLRSELIIMKLKAQINEK